jgi:coenzyme PQQ precursor peptide PqqA
VILTKQGFTDIRFGFEITMYASRTLNLIGGGTVAPVTALPGVLFGEQVISIQ